MKRALILFSILTSSIASWAQGFSAQSDLPAVERDGFYKIALPPEVRSYMSHSLSNARILDNDGQQIPYVIETEKGVKGASAFLPYFIQEKVIIPDSCTILVLRNDSKSSINNIHLIIKNAEVSKEAALYGSDDGKTWYALKGRFRLGHIDSKEGTAEIKIIDFPASDYTYYKLWINDDESGPLNIIRAGYYQTTAEEIRYQEVPIKSVTQENDQKQKVSYVRIALDTVTTFAKITWEAEGMPFYQRPASLSTSRQITNRKGRSSDYLEHITSFEMNARHQATQYFYPTRTDNLLLKISNDDNPPLNIGNIRLYQEMKYLVAWLEKDKAYSLNFGGENMSPPAYDLEFFKDSIPSSLSLITPAKAHPIARTLAARQTTFFTTRMFVWVAIAAVIVALGIMSVKMIRETRAVE